MSKVELKNPTLILTQASQEEVINVFGRGSLYILYKNNKGKVEIGVPDMAKYSSKVANMFVFDKAIEKLFFCKVGESELVIDYRLIYAICRR